MDTSRPRARAAALAVLLLLAVPACKREQPGGPCKIDGAQAPGPPAWPALDAWETGSIPPPPRAWVGSIALSPDGTQAVYTNALGGNFIPVNQSVTMIRLDLGQKSPGATILDLPGEALRNNAALAWSPAGVAWASWSTLGTANPRQQRAKAHYRIPKEGKERPTFPMFTSAGWTPGGDCVLGTMEKGDGPASLIAWKAAGATSQSHQRTIEPMETIAGWLDGSVLLVRVAKDGTRSARTLNLDSGKSGEAPPPPTAEEAQAFTWADGWAWIDAGGTVRWRSKAGEAEATMVAKVAPVLEAEEGQEHRFRRVIAAESGRALVVEESVSAPGVLKRHVHVLTARVDPARAIE